MKKISTLFERDPKTHLVIDEIAVVLPENAVATRKWDGTAAMVKDGKLYQRYTFKTKQRKLSTRNVGLSILKPPPDFIPADEPDPNTGKQPGWRPVPNVQAYCHDAIVPAENGTYELIGPKVQSNAEHQDRHYFIRHGRLTLLAPRSFDAINGYLSTKEIEGIVWWADGEPIAKIKRRDFGLQWPIDKQG